MEKFSRIFLKPNYKKYLYFLFLGFLFLSDSCSKPSFPKEKVADSIKKVCQDEYKVKDVQSKIIGNNLGAWVRVEKLFGGVSDIDSEKMGNVLLSLARVSLSTDAPIQFYTLVIANKAIPGVEYVATRYLLDIKKFWTSTISRDDFEQRMMLRIRFNPAPLAKRCVLNFFSNLSTGNTHHLLTDYLKKSTDSSDFSLSFLRMVLEMRLKDKVHYKILAIKTKALPDEKALVYCQVRETYEMKPGTVAEDITFPSGFVYEYLFVLGASNFNANITEVIPLDYRDENGKFQRRAFPEPYLQFQKVDEWLEDDFDLEEVTLPDFIAGQIALRIVRKINDLEKLAEDKKSNIQPFDFKVESIKGHYLKDEKNQKLPFFQFQFEMTHSKEGFPPQLYDLTCEVIQNVLMEKYHFNEFEEIRLMRSTSEEVKVISKSALQK